MNDYRRMKIITESDKRVLGILEIIFSPDINRHVGTNIEIKVYRNLHGNQSHCLREFETRMFI